MERLGKKDKAVIKAFVGRGTMQGHKLDTDGTRLEIIGLGGSDIAIWRNGKIHFPGNHGSRSGQLVERAVAREAPKNDLYNGRGYNPKGGGTKYRAIKWYRDSDDTTAVGEWHTKRADALRDAYADYAPHFRGFYEIETSNGKRIELTEEQYDRARDWYHGAMQARDARGVWGNPRQKNTHRPESSAREFSAWVRETNEEAIAAAEKGEAGDMIGMLDHVIGAAYALGRASVERRYAGDSVNASDEKDFRALINNRSKWADHVVGYMRDVMGIAANPSGSKAACTVGASAHKSRSAAARQCGAKWKASAQAFARRGGKAAARSKKSPIGKRGKRRSKRRR